MQPFDTFLLVYPIFAENFMCKRVNFGDRDRKKRFRLFGILEHFRFRVHSVCKQCDIPLALHQIEDRRIFYYLVSTLQHFNTKKSKGRKLNIFLFLSRGLKDIKMYSKVKTASSNQVGKKFPHSQNYPKQSQLLKKEGTCFGKQQASVF